ncbi:MAG: hypothetical protein ACREMQ_13905 [Longimicrobiales bacterium]
MAARGQTAQRTATDGTALAAVAARAVVDKAHEVDGAASPDAAAAAAVPAAVLAADKRAAQVSDATRTPPALRSETSSNLRLRMEPAPSNAAP